VVGVAVTVLVLVISRDESLTSRLVGSWICQSQSDSWQASIQQGSWSFTQGPPFGGRQDYGTWTFDQGTSTLNLSGTIEYGDGFYPIQGSATVSGDQVQGSLREANGSALFFTATIRPGEIIEFRGGVSGEDRSMTCRRGSAVAPIPAPTGS
jgi:hypothetical protein